MLVLSPLSLIVRFAGGQQDQSIQGTVWHASDRRPAPIVANVSIERLGLAQWDASALPFEALVSPLHPSEPSPSAIHGERQRRSTGLAMHGLPSINL